MKKQSTIIIISLIVLGFLFSGTSMADEEWNLSDYSGKPHKQKSGSNLDKAVQKAIFRNVLMEKTNLKPEELKEKLEQNTLAKILGANGCDLNSFNTALKKNYDTMLTLLATNQLISEKQKQKLNENYSRRMERRHIMSQLIENGISEKIITREQAETLFHKRMFNN